MTLQPPDSHHLSAAVGWLELGNPVEATLELERIGPRQQRHPDVLEVRWAIYAAEEKWELCLDVARRFSEIVPEDPFGWIHLSFAFHELKRTQEAYDHLKSALRQFPKEWLMRYNMACYACQLGANEEAQQWLDEAKHIRGDAKLIGTMAQTDPDLAPLFKK